MIPRGPFQPLPFCDSMKPHRHAKGGRRLRWHGGTHLSHAMCAAPQQVSAISEMARAVLCPPGAKAQGKALPAVASAMR